MYRLYVGYEEHRAYKQGREDYRKGRRNNEFDEHSSNEINLVYFVGWNDAKQEEQEETRGLKLLNQHEEQEDESEDYYLRGDRLHR